MDACTNLAPHYVLLIHESVDGIRLKAYSRLLTGKCKLQEVFYTIECNGHSTKVKRSW